MKTRFLRLAAFARNNVQWLFARAWVKTTGEDPASVTDREMPVPQMLDALKARQADIRGMRRGAEWVNANMGKEPFFRLVRRSSLTWRRMSSRPDAPRMAKRGA